MANNDNGYSQAGEREPRRNQQEPESLTEFAQQKPLTAVLVAALLGFVLARILF